MPPLHPVSSCIWSNTVFVASPSSSAFILIEAAHTLFNLLRPYSWYNTTLRKFNAPAVVRSYILTLVYFRTFEDNNDKTSVWINILFLLDKSLVRQPSTTEYLPGMLHVASPAGLLPQFPSWSLVCLGPSSLYSHNLGLQDQQKAGLLGGSAYLLPWDVTVRLEHHRYGMNTVIVPLGCCECGGFLSPQLKFIRKICQEK